MKEIKEIMSVAGLVIIAVIFIAVICFLDYRRKTHEPNYEQLHSTDSATIHRLQAQHAADSIRIEYLDGRIVDSLNEVR